MFPSEERKFKDRREDFSLQEVNKAKANVYTLGILLPVLRVIRSSR